MRSGGLKVQLFKPATNLFKRSNIQSSSEPAITPSIAVSVSTLLFHLRLKIGLRIKKNQIFDSK
ncbi:MAG: hypothetical protein COS42_01845 [Flavobacteriales bacterium CG03_land_8_20_14_0_80_35_15]|nr:MAG: hypothetical protein COS42_01845 [Flavobacteriales bacterium CG03_land_8_20_14_0_80_35_15]